MEEYKLAICQIRVRDGIIANFEKISDLTMCKNCEYWHRIGEDTYGECNGLRAITFENFACLDGTKRDEL